MVKLGDTFEVDAVITDYDGSTLTPDDQSVTLYDPAGTLRDTDDTPSGTAPNYTATLTALKTADAGPWQVAWWVEKGGEEKTELLDIYVGEIPG